MHQYTFQVNYQRLYPTASVKNTRVTVTALTLDSAVAECLALNIVSEQDIALLAATDNQTIITE